MIDIQTQEAHGTPNRLNIKKVTPRNITVKLLKVKEYFESKRKVTHHILIAMVFSTEIFLTRDSGMMIYF